MEIITINKIKIAKIVEVLQSGGLVIMPTETLYGAFVDATNPSAVSKLNKYKARPFGKPYSVAVSSQEMAEHYAVLNDTAKNLYKNFLPGPLTVISQGKHKVSPGVESEDGTLGIRIPDYQLVLGVLAKIKKPLTATSANASYKKRPYKVSDILENLSDKQKVLIDLIIDAGTLPTREPSTVIDTTPDDPSILRQGSIKLKGKNEILSKNTQDTMNLGKNLWQTYQKYQGKRAIVFALEGEMGSGKTIFTKGLALAMGIGDEIISPTYDLHISYKTANSIYKLEHFDTWRMVSPSQEIKSLITKDLLNDKSIIAIEWADRIADEIRKFCQDAVIVWVKITFAKKENERIITWGII